MLFDLCVFAITAIYVMRAPRTIRRMYNLQILTNALDRVEWPDPVHRVKPITQHEEEAVALAS